jgi:hypothetical protein
MESNIDTAMLVKALEAQERWFEAENKFLGTFYDRMDLCSYSEYLMKKALAHVRGELFVEEWVGVPQLIITTGGLHAKSKGPGVE